MIVYLVLLIMVIGFVVLLLPLFIEQGTNIAAAMPGYYQNFRGWTIAQPNLLLSRLGEVLPGTLQTPLPAQPTGQQMLSTAGQALLSAQIAAMEQPHRF